MQLAVYPFFFSNITKINTVTKDLNPINTNNNVFSSSFQEYVECSTHTTRRECGEDAAEFSKKFLDKMSSSMIQVSFFISMRMS